ncbi:hypothetical protein [Nocardioides sp. TF02-7]|uniref:hypothetical protein n=1 Tax=Nocardioides sp. TF02-7 TaxID=2917724 RepID=UPI001F05E936|nr:hypothetical protein [Nocardioides sp. TF02-7]UMG91587.1 hypothetical protein MF408_15970 [Nocardioides sp. TF02-7]
MSTTDMAARPSNAPSLRRLYFTRFGFAIVWAGLFAATSDSPLGTFAFALAVLYPLFDLAAAVVDARSATAAGRPTGILYLNMAFSAAAAVALLAVGKDDLGDILVVWGAWAVAAGAVQLVVAVLRKALGGQWPMILSGGISVLAGLSFIAMAGDATSLTSIAGYATLGGLFFLASAIRLGRSADRSPAQVG